MSDQAHDELRDELSAIVEETRRHLLWMQDAGIRQVKREQTATPAAPQAAPAPARDTTGRARPAFLETPPSRPPPTPSRPAPPAAPMPKVQSVQTVQNSANSSNRAAALKVIRDDLGDCRRCGLCSTRTNIVFGQGNPSAEILFLGEGPGEDEDLSGLAFVGRAGQLLTKMIEAMGLTREDVYICNIVKCRPPGNRRPEPDEVEKCRPFVERQIQAIRPKVVVALGATATQQLLRVDTAISRLRNNWQEWQGIPVMPTFHPSYLLRSPQEKGKAWDDLKLVMAKLGRPLPAKKQE